MRLTVEELIKATNGEYHGSDALLPKEITGVSKDSREIEEGYLYLPFVGERADGHAFIAQVFEKKALITLSMRELQINVPYIKVESTEQALKDIAAYYRSKLDTKIIGIVGSVGKTSTKEMVAAVLSKKFKVTKTKGNFNNEIGLPLTILDIRDEHEVAVVEMGISGFDEMTRLAKIARPDAVVMTNIGDCHLENLHDRAGVLKAKSEVIPFIKDDGFLVINNDDEYLKTINEERIEVVRYAVDNTEGALTTACDIESVDTTGITATISVNDKDCKVTIPMAGIHNVYNAMAAASVGFMMNMDIDSIKEGIESVEVLSGRNNRLELDGITVFDDCYNANPMSMKAAISVLSKAKGRKIAVLGDMGELGPTEEELHYSVGEAAGTAGLDLIVLSGKLSRKIAEGALTVNPMQTVIHFDDVEEMKQALLDIIKKGDTILIKASHFMKYDTVVEELKKAYKKG